MHFSKYTKATANTQVVGAEIARLVNSLIGMSLVRAEDVHLIGHNLGAHIAGKTETTTLNNKTFTVDYFIFFFVHFQAMRANAFKTWGAYQDWIRPVLISKTRIQRLSSTITMPNLSTSFTRTAHRP